MQKMRGVEECRAEDSSRNLTRKSCVEERIRYVWIRESKLFKVLAGKQTRMNQLEPEGFPGFFIPHERKAELIPNRKGKEVPSGPALKSRKEPRKPRPINLDSRLGTLRFQTRNLMTVPYQ